MPDPGKLVRIFKKYKYFLNIHLTKFKSVAIMRTNILKAQISFERNSVSLELGVPKLTERRLIIKSN